MASAVEPSQPLLALQLANRVRTQRAEWRRETQTLTHAEGCRRVAGLLRAAAAGTTPAEFTSAPIERLLCSVRYVGRQTVRGWTTTADTPRVTAGLRVGDATRRELLALADAIDPDTTAEAARVSPRQRAVLAALDGLLLATARQLTAALADGDKVSGALLTSLEQRGLVERHDPRRVDGSLVARWAITPAGERLVKR